MDVAESLIRKRLVGQEVTESVAAIVELLDQQVSELTRAATHLEFSELKTNAATLRDVAAMLDGVVDEIGSRTTD